MPGVDESGVSFERTEAEVVSPLLKRSNRWPSMAGRLVGNDLRTLQDAMASSPSSPLELRISPFQIVFSLLVVAGALVLFLGRFLWSMWHAPRGFDATSIVISVIIGGAIGWWIYGGARRMWLETGLYLRADDQDIIVGTRQGRRRLRWEEIYDFTTDSKSTQGKSGYWLSLRGRDDEVLAQWDRNWCRYTAGQIRRGDEIESFVREKLRGLGRLQGEERAATRLWESRHPLSNGTMPKVGTSYGWIGWVSIVVFSPCVFFSWHSRSGGPVVGCGFLLFVALGVYLVSSAATLQVDEERITASSLYGISRMEWSDVTSVQMDEMGTTLVFQGADKRLCFSGPNYWKSAGREEMLLFISAVCEKRGLVFDTRSKPTWGGSRNTRVRRAAGQ